MFSDSMCTSATIWYKSEAFFCVLVLVDTLPKTSELPGTARDTKTAALAGPRAPNASTRAQLNPMPEQRCRVAVWAEHKCV